MTDLNNSENINLNIININDNNIYYLENFIKNDLGDFFRYFKTRNIDVIKNHYVTLIGLIDNVPVAYGHIDIDNNKYWIGLCVLENYRNKKYGTLILQKLLNKFDEKFENDKINLNLTVDKDNKVGQKLYLKYGFVIEKETEKYFCMVRKSNLLYLPVSYGEAIDKLSILNIKLQKIKDERKIEVEKEYDKLYYYLKYHISKCQFYYDMLLKINTNIWEKQDIFRNSSDIESKNKLCIEIIEENDRRFRIKNKINIILNSTLKEQKGYKHKKAFFLGHLGMGDNITTMPAVRYLSTIYDEITVVCKDIYEENLKLLYSDDPTIKLLSIPVSEEYKIHPNRNYPIYQKETEGKDIYLMGIFNPKPEWNKRTNILPFNFYDDINLDYSIFWNYFYIPYLPECDYMYNIIKENKIDKYVFIHNMHSLGKMFDFSLSEEDEKEVLVINPCLNHYVYDHKYYSIAEKFVDKRLPFYKKIIENANELYLTDSSFFCLALGCEIKTDKCYIIPRGDYNHIWEERFKFPSNSNKKKFIQIKNDNK